MSRKLPPTTINDLGEKSSIKAISHKEKVAIEKEILDLWRLEYQAAVYDKDREFARKKVIYWTKVLQEGAK